LQDELPAQQFNTWIRPLQVESSEAGFLLLAPNRFIKDWVADKFMDRILELTKMLSEGEPPSVTISVQEQSSNTASSGFAASSLTSTVSVDVPVQAHPSVDRRSLVVNVADKANHAMAFASPPTSPTQSLASASLSEPDSSANVLTDGSLEQLSHASVLVKGSPE